MRARTLAWLLVAACAPAAPPPPVEPPPPPPAAQPLPARWVLRGSPPRPKAELRLPTGEALQVGEQGRRWRIDRAYAVTHADTLAPVDLVDVRADGEGIVVLGSDGRLLGARGALDPLEARRDGPGERGRFVLGERALIGLTSDGTWLRAADAGAPWTRAPFGLRSGERVADLASDRRGRVAVLLWPQRLLVSTDDGASFRPVPLVGIGAGRLLRDGAGALWLAGRRADGGEAVRHAKLEGAQLTLGGEPAPLVPGAVEQTTWSLAGDRAVLFGTTYATADDPRPHVAIGPVGGPLGPARPLAGPVDRVEAVGHEGRVVLAVVRGASVEVLETADDGAKLDRVGLFERWPFDYGQSLLAAGPGGFVLTRELCDARPAGAPDAPPRGTCAPRVRVGGVWRSLPREHAFGAHAVTADRVVAWDASAKELVEIPFATGAPIATGLRLPDVLALGAEPSGVRLAVLRFPPRLAYLEGRAVVRESPLPGPVTAASFVGPRGVLALSAGGLFETADAGDHWLPIATAGHQAPRCHAAGCSFGEALRLGWDLPARQAAAVARLPAPPPPAPGPAPRQPPRAAPVDLDCAAGARWSPLPPALDSLDRRWKLGLAGDSRWVNLVHDRDDPAKTKVLVVRGGAAPAVRELGLARATGKLHQRFGDEGLLRAFFEHGARAPDGGYGPVDATLGWLDAATGKAGKATLRGLPPFRVGQSELAALLAVVDGGVVLLPQAPGSALRFAQLDGRVETWGAPPAATRPYDQVVRAGSALVLAAGERDLELALTTDKGRTWKTATWSLGDSAWLTVMGGAPAVLVASGGDPLAVLPIGALAGDIPEWRPVERPGALEPCDPRASPGARWEHLVSGEVRLHLAAGGLLESQMRFTRAEAANRRCTAAVLAYDAVDRGAQLHALVAPHDLGHGHLTRKGAKGLEWTTLSCKRR